MKMDETAIVTVQNLLTVKSITTIMMTIVFCILAIKETISGDQFLTVFSVVIAFYFGTQFQKGQSEKEGDTHE